MVERILALKGNSARGERKRYRCNLTHEEITRLALKCLETQPSDLVFAALEKFSWGEGFTRADRFVQRMALQKWIRKEAPRLMDSVEGLLARIDKPTQKALIRQARDGREDLEYITSPELHDLHESLQAALA